MKLDISRLNAGKQVLLAISIVYFYGLALALSFGLPLYGLDHPLVFAIIGGFFFIAILLEAGVTWWHHRRRVAWGLFLLMCYAIFGFILAPMLYGNIALWIALIAPLVAMFIGGFMYAYAHIFHGIFFSHMKLSSDVILAALRPMPGWELVADHLEKTFRFSSYSAAVEFMGRVIVAARTHHREPEIILERRSVKLRLSTPSVGVTEIDLTAARDINAL